MKLEYGNKVENLLLQTLQDLNDFTEKHLIDAEPKLLRNKLRFLHQILPKGEFKNKTRGALNYLNRWSREKAWVRITSTVMKLMDEYEIDTLEAEKILWSDRFVKPSTVLAILSSPEMENKGEMAIFQLPKKRKSKMKMIKN